MLQPLIACMTIFWQPLHQGGVNEALPFVNEPGWRQWDGMFIPLGAELTETLNGWKSFCPDRPLNVETSLGVSEARLRECMMLVSRAVIAPELDLKPRQAAPVLATKLRECVYTLSPKLERIVGFKPSERLVEFLRFQAVVDWVRTHITFDTRYATHQGQFQDGLPGKRQGVQGLLDQDVPSTICGPFSWAVVELAALAGLTNVGKVEGFVWQASNALLPRSDQETPWHSWNLLRLSDGSVCYVDPTIGRIGLKLARARSGFLFSPYSLPLSEWERNLFTATHWGMRGHLIVARRNNSPYPEWIANSNDARLGVIGVPPEGASFLNWKGLHRERIARLVDYFFRDTVSADSN